MFADVGVSETRKWDVDDVNNLLASMGTAVSWNQTLAVACQWLKDNRHVWQDWVPHSTTCLAGQGLYSTVEDSFVNQRANAATCRACSPGPQLQGWDGQDSAGYEFVLFLFGLKAPRKSYKIETCSPGSPRRMAFQIRDGR